MAQWNYAGVCVPGYNDVCHEIIQCAAASFALRSMGSCIAAPLGAVVHGPPGVGKSKLVAALVEAWAGPSMIVRSLSISDSAHYCRCYWDGHPIANHTILLFF